MIEIVARFNDDAGRTSAPAIHRLKVILPSGRELHMSPIHFPDFVKGANRLIMIAQSVDEDAEKR
jgi:hypothetical protein